MKLAVAHRSLPKIGEFANGDRAFVRSDGSGRSLIAVIDGLGHGPGADAASRAATECLDRVSLQAPLLDMMEDVHSALTGSRGAAATVCVLRDGRVEACAVGNVELHCSPIRLPLIFSRGVLGVRVAKFRICEAPLNQAARIVLFSDGISSGAKTSDLQGLSPDVTCDTIMTGHRREHDDATVLVADVKPVA